MTRVTTPCAYDHLAFDIAQESKFNKIAKRTGFRDVQVDDPAYDDSFTIKAASPKQFQRLFTSEFRDHHLETPDSRVGAERGKPSVVRPGVIADLDELLRLLEFAVVAARTFAPTDR